MHARKKRKLRIFPEIVLIALVLLGALSALDEAWKAPEPRALVAFLYNHHLWQVWLQLRWNYMYSHGVLHFLSGLFGSLLGCWMYFGFRREKGTSSPITKDEQGGLP